MLYTGYPDIQLLDDNKIIPWSYIYLSYVGGKGATQLAGGAAGGWATAGGFGVGGKPVVTFSI